MPLFARNFQQLMSDSIESLSSNTRLTRLSAGGKARAILEAVNRRIEEQYTIFDLNLARAFVSAAPGQYLDLIGALLSLPREASVAASVSSELECIKFYVDSGTFGDINNNADILVPAGTIISTSPSDTGILFKTTQDFLLLANRSIHYVSAQAMVPGEDANLGTGSLVYHGFSNYADYLNEPLKVSNIHPIANGKNFESDDNYRFRITNRVLEVEAGNETAIRLACLSTPGVADALIVPRYRGIGTFGIIVQSVFPTVTQDLLDDVTANVLKVKSLGDYAYVRGPKETGLSLRTTIYYSKDLSAEEYEDIEIALEDAIRTYVNSLDIGETFILNRMVSDLFGLSEYIVNFGKTGYPIEELYVHRENDLGDNKVRQQLLSNYVPASDERVIIEPSVLSPIVFTRKVSSRNV